MRKRIYRNQDIKRLVVGTPLGHQHIRLKMEFNDGEVLVLQEATIAGIVRAFVNIKMHPKRHVIELISQEVKGKSGFAKHQLIDSLRTENEILEDFDI